MGMSAINGEEQYVQRAVELRNNGRFDEAILAARQATTLNADSANAWWQLGLALAANNELTAAGNAYEKVTHLAPRFASGWAERGLAYKRTARLDKAIACYEEGLKADTEHVRTLSLMETALQEREGSGDAKRRLDILQTLHHLGELSLGKYFDLGYGLSADKDFAGAVLAYERYTGEFAERAAFFNLGLAYEALGRDADAIDAFTIASRFQDESRKARQSIDRLRPKVSKLRQRVLAPAGPRLASDDWYKHYVNPFALLGVQDAPDMENDARAIQKARQALFREIDLEEGRLDWMPGMVIDKSSAMTILDELNDEAKRQAHRLVWQTPELNAFLSCGSLDHFLVADVPHEDITMPYQIDEDILAVVSEPFARQFDLVLTRAIEQGDVDAVECMFDGRRWILPEHEALCHESAHRALERLYAPLKKLIEESAKRKVSRVETDNALARGKLHAMLVHLPPAFETIHAAIWDIVSDLALAAWKRDEDAENAKGILGLCKVSTDKTPALRHQFSEHEKVLDELIEKEKQTEAHRLIDRQQLHITRSGVMYGTKKIERSEIYSVRWGRTVIGHSPRIVRCRLAFKDRYGGEIDVGWTSQRIEEQEETWRELLGATMHHLMDDIVANLKSRLRAGTYTAVGSVELREEGVVFEVSGWFSKKKVLCAWSDVVSELRDGYVFLRDATNRAASASLPIDTTDNAVILHMLASNKTR
jgi:tetratricopeptide (TPR) repeat protein